MNKIIQILPIEFLLIVHAFAVNMATIVCDVRCIGVDPIPLLQEPKNHAHTTRTGWEVLLVRF